jgi:hypothetical protein
MQKPKHLPILKPSTFAPLVVVSSLLALSIKVFHLFTNHSFKEIRLAPKWPLLIGRFLKK